MAHVLSPCYHFLNSQRRAQQTYKELTAKERLLRQQNSLREGLEQKQNLVEQAVKDNRNAPLAEGWKEVEDAKTGATYYWNKASRGKSRANIVPASPVGRDLDSVHHFITLLNQGHLFRGYVYSGEVALLVDVPFLKHFLCAV